MRIIVEVRSALSRSLCCGVLTLGLLIASGCTGTKTPDRQSKGSATTQKQDGVGQPEKPTKSAPFGVYWPPRSLKPPTDSDALLRGELSVFEDVADRSLASFRLRITLRRPDGERDRIRWNRELAFPEYAWMSRVRVWDRENKWLWPNLPYLLQAHGEERVKRYGGVDPGKGVDNDFAAVLIRPITSMPAATEVAFASELPLVAAEWYPVDAESRNGRSVVHAACSDDFHIELKRTDAKTHAAAVGVWLIYADFLNASLPSNWPDQGEWAGGVLAYFQVSWRVAADGRAAVEIEQRVPPSDTGFDWERWSTGESALAKNLRLRRETNRLD